MTVSESYGLFAYTEDVIETAKKFDLWNPDLSDTKVSKNVKRSQSMQQEEELASAKFFRILPDLDKMWYNENSFDNVASYLRGLGYQGKSTENEGFDGGYSGNFQFKDGDRECIIYYCIEDHGSRVIITITGDEKVLDEYYQLAITKSGQGIEWGTTVSKEGNNIYYNTWGA